MPKQPETYDVTTIDGKVHRGFLAYSAAQAGLDFLLSDPGYRDEDIVPGGVKLRRIETTLIGKRIMRKAA